MTLSISMNVTHAPWIEERRATLDRLRAGLGVCERKDPGEPWVPVSTPAGPYTEETTRASAWQWQELQLRWALEQNVDWCFFAQDDCVVPENPRFFWQALEAMCAGSGHEIICLHNGHPAARTVFAQGAPGYTTVDGMVGQFWGATKSVVARYAEWKSTAVDRNLTEKMIQQNDIFGEDVLLAMFCMHEGLRIFHPVPTLYDHDTSVETTNEGYEEHLYRAPQVCWYDTHRAAHEIRWSDPAWWGREAVHLGRFYETSHAALPLVLRDRAKGSELAARYRAEVCPEPYRRYFHRVTAIA